MKRKYLSYALSLAITFILSFPAYLALGGTQWWVLLCILSGIVGGVSGALIYPHQKNGSEYV